MADYNIPGDLKYVKTDEWLRLEGGEAVIGVSDYAQHALSDVVYVELPSVGATYKAGDTFGSVESVKAASDMHMPIGGSVIEVNSSLETSPELINQEPYGRGWFIRIKPTDTSEAEKLMDAAAYTKYCDGRD